MSKQATTPPSDLDLMLYADGELGPDQARAVAAWLEGSAEGRAKLEGLRQVGGTVRTYLELETDRLELETDRVEDEVPAFAGLWDRIERRIHANGVDAPEQGAARAAAAAEPARPAARADDRPRTRAGRTEAGEGLWASIRGWFEGHRGHFVTGAISAGAVAALMLALGPRDTVVVERPVVSGGGGVTRAIPAALESQPPEVEDLEVHSGSGTILTIEPEGEADSAAAVIWISSDDDSMEDPI